MSTKIIESQYNEMLAFNYGNTERLIKNLKNSLKLYRNAKNQQHSKVKERIKLYSKIIDYAKNNRITKLKNITRTF